MPSPSSILSPGRRVEPAVLQPISTQSPPVARPPSAHTHPPRTHIAAALRHALQFLPITAKFVAPPIYWLHTQRSFASPHVPAPPPVEGVPAHHRQICLTSATNTHTHSHCCPDLQKEFLPITAKFVGSITQKEAEAIAPIGEWQPGSWRTPRWCMPCWHAPLTPAHSAAVGALELSFNHC